MNSEQKMILARIESALNNVTISYWNNLQFMLTERDLVAKVFSLLDGRLGRFKVHSEIRPFIKRGKNDYLVIRKRNDECDWHEAGRNTGSRFDLCVIDTHDDFWKEAKEKAEGKSGVLRYWRLPSYPYKGIRAAVEFKVRVSGNAKRIDSDIQKLKLMCEDDNQCLIFLLILDRCASDRNLANIKARVEDAGIHFFGLNP